jgi:hypothetical protein
MINSKNLGTRSTENGALDRKIRTLETLKGQRDISGGVWGYLWNFECLESFGAKEQGLLRSLGIFCGFLERLEWFRSES